MRVSRELLNVLDEASIPYDVDLNQVHTPYGVIYDLSDPLNGFDQRYELENGEVFTSAEELIEELLLWAE